MVIGGVILMCVGIVLFAIGFCWSADDRVRAWVNQATIVSVYFGLVLVLTDRLLDSAP